MNMKKEGNASEIVVLAQLLTAMEDAVVKMGSAQKDKDVETLTAAKHEILELRKRIDELL